MANVSVSPSARRLALGSALAAAVGLGAHSAGALTAGGASGAALVGGAVFGCGPPGASPALVAFFLSGSALTRLPGALDARDRDGRTLGQVLANGAVAALGSVLGAFRPSASTEALIGGALATATADTWATEIGTRWGGAPRLITSGRPVPPGADGGVTPAGLVAAVAGAAFVAAAYTLASASAPRRDGERSGEGGGDSDSRAASWGQGGWSRCDVFARHTPRPTPARATGNPRPDDRAARARVATSCVAGGVVGALADSVLGATLEGRCPGGVRLGNNGVNLLATLAGGAASALSIRLSGRC